MDGNYLRDNEVYKKLQKWVLEAISSRPFQPFVSMDIDAWVQLPLEPEIILQYAIDIFLDTVELIKKNKLENVLQPAMALSLSCSEQLLLWKNASKIVDDFIDTPPSIYLTEREAFKQLVAVEEYKTPINLEIPSLKSRNIYTYYRCHRNLRDFQNNWEYARSVHLEYYPDDLIFEKE